MFLCCSFMTWILHSATRMAHVGQVGEYFHRKERYCRLYRTSGIVFCGELHQSGLRSCYASSINWGRCIWCAEEFVSPWTSESIPVTNCWYVFSVRARVRALTPLQQFWIIMQGIISRLNLFNQRNNDENGERILWPPEGLWLLSW